MSHPALEKAWSGGGAALGTFVSAFPTDAVLRTLAGVGYDFVGIDCQHGVIDETGAGEILRRSGDLGCAVLVRVRGLDDAAIGRVLDAGADGIVVPMVSTADEARAAVAACRFPPAGVRSFGPARADLGVDIETIAARADCFVMIETAEGLQNVGEIAAVDGVAGLYVGPVDLGIALGVPFAEVPTSDRMAAALERVREACDAAGVVAGCFGGAHNAAQLVAGGYRIVSIGADVMILASGARRELDDARGGASAPALDRYGA